MKYEPYNYQVFAEQHVIDNPFAGLFQEMGLGKTVITLTAIDRLKFSMFEIGKVLIVAPKRVADLTWTQERDKWDHLNHLRMVKVMGTEWQRKEALYKKADIYLINRDNLPWLIAHLGDRWPFDMVVLDELSSFKSSDSIRFRQFKKKRPFCKRVVGLTGTPAPNSLIDLWPQLYCLDQGERLGKTITEYRDNYFKPGKRNGSVIYTYDLKKQAKEAIYRRIGDICISMKAEDYLDLPELIYRYVSVPLGEATYAKYLEFEEMQIMELETGEEITALNAAALSGKLLQYANGAVYGKNKAEYHVMHDEKLEALEEIIEGANGKPVIVFYWFKHDLERINERFKKLKPRGLSNEKDINDWNAGKIALLCLQPQSAGHGLNLQAGGNIIVWFGLTWSLELYQQANKRLHRPGQIHNVIIHHLVAAGTMDEEVMQTLSRKEKGQDALMKAVKALVTKYSK